MSTENQTELFIRVLTDALEEDRLIKALQHKERAEHFMQLCRSNRDDAVHLFEPLGRVQPMAAKAQELRIG